MKIFVASSWENTTHDPIVQLLRNAGHQVYDYRNPLDHESLTMKIFTENPYGSRTVEIVRFNLDALNDANAIVALLPAGASNHIEIGYALANHKMIILHTQTPPPPEAYYIRCFITHTNTELLKFLKADPL